MRRGQRGWRQGAERRGGRGRGRGGAGVKVVRGEEGVEDEGEEDWREGRETEGGEEIRERE